MGRGSRKEKKKVKVCLDINRPSHGRTWLISPYRTYNPAVSAWLSARRLGSIGPRLLLGAIALGFFSLFFGEFVGRISSVLIVAIPLLVLLTLAGFIMTLIGGVGWALQAPIRRLVWFGIAQERVKRIVLGNRGGSIGGISLKTPPGPRTPCPLQSPLPPPHNY